ncbi:MAG TPA: hypothetical protein EYN89_14195, partial [Flavobacteriales bacterium]|nr:hypothetical protein [Flavobacteriales bacterium]
MMKNIFVTILLLFPWILFGQSFTNDWIEYDKQYYKFTVYEDGIYRIDYSALVDAGIPVSSISPQQFQIFYKGEEQYIYVEGTGPSDSILSPGEFIEFYGEKNTGWLDTAWYADPAWHANPNVSIYTDTSTYFLTWTSSGQTNRLGVEDDVDFTGYVPADYFLHESRQDYYTNYSGGVYWKTGIGNNSVPIYDSEYTETKGWFSPSFTALSPFYTSTPGIHNSGPNAEAKYVLVGTNLQDHDVDVTIGSGPANNHTYNSTKVNKLSYNIPLTYLGGDSTAFIFTPKAPGTDRNAVGYISIKYAHIFDLGGASAYKMSVLDNQISTKSFLSIANFTTSSPCWLFDLTNHKRIKTTINNGVVRALVPNSNGEKECYLSSETSTSTITELKGVGSMGTAKFTDYTIIDPDSAYLIISNEKLY